MVIMNGNVSTRYGTVHNLFLLFSDSNSTSPINLTGTVPVLNTTELHNSRIFGAC